MPRVFAVIREIPASRKLELNPVDNRLVENQLCKKHHHHFFLCPLVQVYFRIQIMPVQLDGFRTQTKRFLTYQDLRDGFSS